MREEIFAVTFDESITVPGYYDSDPHDTINVTIFKEFKSKEEFEDWVSENTGRYASKTFTAYKCRQLEVKTEVVVKYD